MQPDLLGLEFSKGELRRLTGVAPDNIFRASIFQNSKKRLKFLSNEILIWFTISTIVIGLSYTFILLFNIGSPNKSAIALLILVPSVVAVGRWLWRKKNCPKRLKNLLDDIDKYHVVIERIDRNDLLEAGIAELNLNNRSLLIEALQLTREDLVKALKAERRLRNNNSSIAPELFNNHLQALTAIQASNQASEYGQILNEVLQINISIQQEMRRLQGKRSNKK
ncbi:MAG: hypothetical protein KME05_20850 [Gloeocapsa sp. UFS-A4-WI-NPMV-4B04]|jgi:hypothetical protein|nr:hypothetical protein [Gloeocapsa sp. UFS-A4-WI-NPMV-4B04]